MVRGDGRTRLERLVRQSDRTIDEWCAAFDQAAQAMGERTSLSARQLQRWMAGKVDSARPAARRVAAQLWGMDFAALLEPPDGIDLLSGSVPAGQMAASESRPGATGDRSAATVLGLVTNMAAHESTDHAMSVSGEVNVAMIEQVQSEVRRLALAYATSAPLSFLADARRVRDLAYAALDRTRRPGQTADLYLATGQLCGLMSVASFDLAVWDAAAEQARAAYVYGDLVDHNGLRTWTRGTQALIEYWTGRPRAALIHIEAGLAASPSGTGLARLRAIEARALSQLGDRNLTQRAIAAADDAQHSATGADDLYDDVGGEFGWGPARHAACVGTALLTVGDWRSAADRANSALQMLPTDPASSTIRERTHIDLATADLALGHLDAVKTDLEPVWDVPIPRRRHALTDRLIVLARALTAPAYGSAPQAISLRDQIEVFTTEAQARSLPAT
jgi:hypothetical protein